MADEGAPAAAPAEAPKRRGFAFAGKALKSTPEELKEIPKREDSMRPSGITTARVMFSSPAAAAPKPKVAPRTAAAAPPAPKPRAPRPKPAAPAAAEAPEGEDAAAEAAAAPAAAPSGSSFRDMPEDLRTMAELILAEETKEQDAQHLYNTDVPEAYIPASRRGFQNFIRAQYSPFQLPKGPIEIPEGEKYYPYQKFVRDYMRKESPYRGVLVYHGLGSGKTCTSIATAEALFAAGKRKIIVMAPKSLKKNFFKEISFCGFRHFQLKNFWIPLDPKDPNATIFATQVLGLSAKHVANAKNIWVPNFRKNPTDTEFNAARDGTPYDQLDDEDRIEIRKQIRHIVEWHPENNPTGRIRFVAYNGIPAWRLIQYACQEGEDRFFDNAVIVIDEVHNLVRNMTGKIDAYMRKPDAAPKGRKRVIPVEPVTPGRYKPSICDPETKLYTRGYLFYRLLLDAKNSKIVGLSGTPLINFPEELGVLANMLHGYFTIGEAVLRMTGREVQDRARKVAEANRYIDFFRAVQKTDETGGTVIQFSLLAPGLRKIEGEPGKEGGVERIPPEETPPTLEEVIETIKKDFADARLDFFNPAAPITLRTEPLLPFTAEDFRKDLITPAGDAVNNEPILIRRLTGLVSYYKGSRLELMPEVKEGDDVIVRVPFSLYAQKAYSFRRSAEIDREMKSSGKAGVDATWAKIYALSDSGGANSYKMGSRQACNFAFPPEVVRPMPGTKAEERSEAGAGQKEDIVALPADDAADAEEEAALAQEYPEMDVEAEEKEEAAGNAVEEEAQALFEEEEEEQGGGGKSQEEGGVGGVLGEVAEAMTGLPTSATRSGSSNSGSSNSGSSNSGSSNSGSSNSGSSSNSNSSSSSNSSSNSSSSNEESAAPAAAPAAAPEAAPATGVKAALLKARAAACKTGRKPGEKYQDACARARECLLTVAKPHMILGGPDGLANYSGKFAAMLTNIAAAPGSSLVYSQFLDMEGIGIFRTAMEANGYVPIEIEEVGWYKYGFSKRTIESFKPGNNVMRYMTFSGKEDQNIRQFYLDIFNAKFAEIPDEMAKIIRAAGYTDNKVGEIARVFCITSAGAEGLSLRNVRAVHLMEPYWNEVRMRQVKGRAIRIGSHLDLPPDQRNVKIFTYISCFSEQAQLAKMGEVRIDETILQHDSIDDKKAQEYGLPLKPGQKSYTLTTDEMIYVIAERKRRLISNMEKVLKSAAVDCPLNYNQNQDPNDPFKCFIVDITKGVGDFMFNPIFSEDIKEAGKYGRVGAAEGEGAGAAAAAAAPPPPPMTEYQRLDLEQKAIQRKIEDAKAKKDVEARKALELQREGIIQQMILIQRKARTAAPAAAAAAPAAPAAVEEAPAPAAAAPAAVAAAPAPAAAPPAPPPAAPKPKEFDQEYKKKTYRVREILGADGKPTGYEMFFQGKKVGTAGYNPLKDRPGPPVTFVEGYTP